MAKCKATKRDGSPCTLDAQRGNDLCWAHSPEHAEARRRGARRGGRAKPLSELSKLKGKLEALGDDVLAGKASRGNAAVAATCYGTAIKAIEAEVKVRELLESRLIETGLKVKEQEEIQGRLERLEELLEDRDRSGVGGWG